MVSREREGRVEGGKEGVEARKGKEVVGRSGALKVYILIWSTEHAILEVDIE